MPNEPARLWVEALRSGQYRQGHSALRNDDAYCCLGVACEVYRQITGAGDWEREDSQTGRQAFRAGRSSSTVVLPKLVQRWLGLVTEGGTYNDSSLYKDNDEKGKTLEEIADIIESEPEGLFVD